MIFWVAVAEKLKKTVSLLIILIIEQKNTNIWVKRVRVLIYIAWIKIKECVNLIEKIALYTNWKKLLDPPAF